MFALMSKVWLCCWPEVEPCAGLQLKPEELYWWTARASGKSPCSSQLSGSDGRAASRPLRCPPQCVCALWKPQEAPRGERGHFKVYPGDFPGGPVVEALPSSAGGVGLIPGWGAKDPTCITGQKTKTQNGGNIVTNSIKTLKMIHVKKNSWNNYLRTQWNALTKYPRLGGRNDRRLLPAYSGGPSVKSRCQQYWFLLRVVEKGLL